MNPTSSTLKFVGVAAVSALVAVGAWKASQPSQVEGFGDVGQEFFSDFDDVTKTAALTVVDYDDEEKEVQTFSVKQNDDGLWTIPSHNDYPAEAADRLAKTATSLMGVKKTAVKSRRKDDWKRFGVVDPSEDGVATAEERGTRLTLSDGSGNPLVDLIVGNEVEGQDKQYHVREPEKNTTYIAELDVDLSAKFSDWIEPDLLKINSSDVVKIILDNYSVNEERGTVEKTELLEFQKEDLETTGDWKLVGLDEEKEELDKSPVSSIATNLDQLKIVGVRKKPPGLDDNLRVDPVVKQILQSQMQALGYFIGGDKDGKERLYSNEGELVAGTDKGVEYTLYFGEIARGSGKDIEVGLSDEAKASEEKDDENSEGDDGTNEEAEDGPRRYLLVKVGFNEALLGEKPVAPLEPEEPEILKEEDKKEEAEAEKKEESEGEEKDNSGDEDEADSSEDDDACGPEDEESDESADAEAQGDDPTELKEEASDSKDDPTEKEATPDEPKKKEATDEPVKKSAADSGEDKDAAADEKPAKETEKPADEKEEAPKAPEKDPKQVAQEQFDAAMSAYKSEKSTYDSDLKKYEDNVKEGKEKVDELSLRFAGWYYVISSDSFEKFRIERKDVVSKKEEEKEDDKEKEDAEK